MKLGISIPFYNEDAVIPHSLPALMDALSKLQHDSVVVLVNNGSTDNTKAQLSEWCTQFPDTFRLCDLPHNQGYGGGILAGLRMLEQESPDWIGWMWGDDQIDPNILSSLCSALTDGTDMAKANRIQRQDGWRRMVVTRAYHTLMQLKGHNITDINGCPKVMTQNLYKRIRPDEPTWLLDPEVMIAARKLKAQIHQEATIMRPRRGGASKVKVTTVLSFLKYVWGL